MMARKTYDPVLIYLVNKSYLFVTPSPLAEALVYCWIVVALGEEVPRELRHDSTGILAWIYTDADLVAEFFDMIECFENEDNPSAEFSDVISELASEEKLLPRGMTIDAARAVAGMVYQGILLELQEVERISEEMQNAAQAALN